MQKEISVRELEDVVNNVDDMDTNIYEVILTDIALEELDEIYEYIHKNLNNTSSNI